MEVLSILHAGPPDTLRETKLILQKYTGEHALISDEFTREVYPDWDKPGGAIEAQFVIHNWNARFARNLERVLGKENSNQIMQGVEAIGLEYNTRRTFSVGEGCH